MIKESGIVERLRARLQRDRNGNFDPELSIKLGHGIYEEVLEAATLIAELQAERDRDRLHWNGRAVELQVNGHGWMKAHDQLLGWVQSHPEMLRAMTDEKFAVKYPSPADVPEILQRALAAESSLHRVRGETIEECAKAIETSKLLVHTNLLYMDLNLLERRLGDSLVELANALRSLNITGLDTGAVKTAESCHSPSTLNAETE